MNKTALAVLQPQVTGTCTSSWTSPWLFVHVRHLSDILINCWHELYDRKINHRPITLTKDFNFVLILVKENLHFKEIFNVLQWFTKTTFLLFIAENDSIVFLTYRLVLKAVSSAKGKYERNSRSWVTTLG